MRFIRTALFTLFILALMTSCGKSQPAELVAPTHTTEIQPTATASQVPPTATLPPPTEASPPEPTPTPEKQPPLITGLSDQTIGDGESFERLDLRECVSDEDHSLALIHWDITGNVELTYRNVGGILLISTPGADWTGSETLHFEACDPDDLCDAVDVTFTVMEENDSPIIKVGDQVILPGEVFEDIILANAASDEDHSDDEITWEITEGQDLSYQVNDGVVTVTPADPAWRGKETIKFQACDPEGACSEKEVIYWIMDDSDPVEITYIGSSGFMITAGDKKILIDAIWQGNNNYSIPDEIINAILEAQPPFDDVDLVLVTHSHADHFTGSMVRQHLQNNPNAVFVSTYDAVSQLPALEDVRDRVIPIELRSGERQRMIVQDIGLEMLYISHGIPLLNIGYIITVGGARIFHTGDIATDVVDLEYLQAYGLPDKNIDVAMIPHFCLTTEEDHPLIQEGIQAEYLVPMHFAFTMPRPNYGLMEEYFPDAIVFREEMESWTLP